MKGEHLDVYHQEGSSIYLDVDIDQYILKPKEERQQHIHLEDPCEEGSSFAQQFVRQRLAEHLEVTMPSGHKILCCHACNNNRCINLQHVYFGTPRENQLDGKDINPKKYYRYVAYLLPEQVRQLAELKEIVHAPSINKLICALIDDAYEREKGE